MSTCSYQAYLLVDGYNIIGHWPRLKTLRQQQGLEAAREELIEILINFSANKDYQTEIVFDAQYRNSPCSKERFTSSLSVCYTAFLQTADTYIERICADYSRNQGEVLSRLIVATSDQAEKLTILGYGAEWLSAQRLGSEVDSAINNINKRKRPKKKNQGRFLASSLDAKVQQKLSQLRLGMIPPDA